MKLENKKKRVIAELRKPTQHHYRLNEEKLLKTQTISEQMRGRRQRKMSWMKMVGVP